MAQETLKELKYNGSKVIAEVARRDDEGNRIVSTYLTDVQIISEDEINAAFETVFGKNTTTTLKKILDARKSAYCLFYEYDGASIDSIIKYNDTSNVTEMYNTFGNCSNLTTIPLLNTNNVTAMDYMFQSCSSLTTIPLLNTSNVTNMSHMFEYCYELTSIPQLNTSNVTDMRYMFSNCRNLMSIPALDTSNVTDMEQMFVGCRSLIKISMLNIANNLSISSCTKMTRDALLEVLGNLKDLTGSTSKTLTLGSTLLAKLTDEDKLIATNKNWTLA